MASFWTVTTPLSIFITRLKPTKLVSQPSASTNACTLKPLRVIVAASSQNVEQITARRSGNYPPSIWNDDYIQTLTSVYTEESYTRRAEKLKKDVRLMVEKVLEPLDQLKLIDDLQRLGLSYHYKDVIDTMLRNIYISSSDSDYRWKDDDLYATALKFRLLRDHGYHVPQEVFGKFKDETESFMPCLSTDTKGLLSLYEASYLLLKGENMLEEARDFTTSYLVENLSRNMDQFMAMQVSHALEIPLHWMMPRQETRWFIDIYARRSDMNSTLLELAILDFNIVQATHQEDLKTMSRWWRDIGLSEKLSFARNRLVESFLWNVGVTFEPQYVYSRRMSTKVNVLITMVDDIYDVYGTLDELVLFTDAIERWDVNSIEQLPEYMQICFLALFNSINEMAYDILRDKGFSIISYLKQAWADLCKSYFKEAQWYYNGYTPTLDEYINNASFSIAAPVILIHNYVFIEKPMEKDALECLVRNTSVIRWSSMLLRLADDLGTSSDELKRGDVPKSIQCYMHETGASEEEARQYVKNLIGETWKKMNEDRFSDLPFTQNFIASAMNLGRTAQFMYQHGDGHGASTRETKDRVLALVIEPIIQLEIGIEI